MRSDVSIRPEGPGDYLDIVRLELRSFSEGTTYSDGTDIIAFIEEIRGSEFYIPDMSFVAVLEGKVVGHFMFSKMPLSKIPQGGHGGSADTDIVMLAPVAVHADYFRQGVGTSMLTLGIEKAKERGYKGIIVEGDNKYYNRLGFQTSADYGIYPTSGWPMDEPKFMMCQETYPGSLKGQGGYVVYDMYKNA